MSGLPFGKIDAHNQIGTLKAFTAQGPLHLLQCGEVIRDCLRSAVVCQGTYIWKIYRTASWKPTLNRMVPDWWGIGGGIRVDRGEEGG